MRRLVRAAHERLHPWPLLRVDHGEQKADGVLARAGRQFLQRAREPPRLQIGELQRELMAAAGR